MASSVGETKKPTITIRKKRGKSSLYMENMLTRKVSLNYNMVGSNIKEIFVHYDISRVERGREHFHVKEYQAPEDNFVSIDTTQDSVTESLLKIVNEI